MARADPRSTGLIRTTEAVRGSRRSPSPSGPAPRPTTAVMIRPRRRHEGGQDAPVDPRLDAVLGPGAGRGIHVTARRRSGRLPRPRFGSRSTTRSRCSGMCTRWLVDCLGDIHERARDGREDRVAERRRVGLGVDVGRHRRFHLVAHLDRTLPPSPACPSPPLPSHAAPVTSRVKIRAVRSLVKNRVVARLTHMGPGRIYGALCRDTR